MTTLKNVMMLNAMSSGATGLLFILFSKPAAGLFGVTWPTPFFAVGMFLVIFACLVFYHSRKTPMSKGWIKFIVLLDILWVVESIILVTSQMIAFSTIGSGVIIMVALWVAIMAILQAYGLKKISIQPH